MKYITIMTGSTKSLSLLLAFILSAASLTLAQVRNPQLENPKYGPDPATREECLKNTSFYTEYYKQGNYKDAATGWGVVYTICPKSSKNVFIRGLKMIRTEIAREQDPQVRAQLVDSMLRIYDKRIKYFREEGQCLTDKGSDLYKFMPERRAEAYEILNQALAIQRERMEPSAMLALMQIAKDLYQVKHFPADTVMEVYTRLSDIFARQLLQDPGNENLRPMSESLDQLFTSAGVASCENLVAIYTPKLEAAPEDVNLARTIYNQLSALRCTSEPLYARVGEVLYRSAPTPQLALELARIYVARQENSAADQKYSKAIELEQDPMQRAAMLVEYANFVGLNMAEMTRAKALALQALKENPNLGLAYFLLGQLYGSSKGCGNSKLSKSSVFWAAVDKFVQAKTVDPSLTADCNKQISFYSQHFPSMEEIFYNDLEVGQPYTTPCWVNERTTVRAKE